MAKLNAVGQQRRFWGVMPTLSGPEMIAIGKQMEQVGFEGAFSLQIYGPPFVPLAAVGAGTEKLKVGTGVAVAGSRSPVETAFAAMDVDRITNGRFVLGLGTSLKASTVGIYGMPDYKLVAHLRDTVAAVRYIIANAHKGLDPYNGEYYKATFEEMMLTPPPVREHIPIWIGALKDKLVETALEIGDGLMVHSLWSANYLKSRYAFIESTLAKFGRTRGDVEIIAWPWLAVNDDMKQAIEDSRATIAAYCGYKQYENFFEDLGFGDEARACQLALGQHGDVSSVVKNVPDEMVTTFVACGSVGEVMEQIEPFWDTIDSMCPMTPFRDLSLAQMQFYNEGIFKVVAAASQGK